jgi:hypothetical protein
MRAAQETASVEMGSAIPMNVHGCSTIPSAILPARFHVMMIVTVRMATANHGMVKITLPVCKTALHLRHTVPMVFVNRIWERMKLIVQMIAAAIT